MNIVKGVADLLRKSATAAPGGGGAGGSGGGGGGGGDRGSPSADRVAAAPSPRVRFSDSGEEGVLNTLWQKYESAIDKAEKKKSLQIFVLHFVKVFKDWEAGNTEQSVDQESLTGDIVLGCYMGHPSEVILILVQEISQITSSITETAVVKLKTLTSLLAADEQLSNKTVENMKMMQKILVYIVTIISNFMDLEPTAAKISQFISTSGNTLSSNFLATVTQNTIKSIDINWQKKAIVSVMEAGGVNWSTVSCSSLGRFASFRGYLKNGGVAIETFRSGSVRNLFEGKKLFCQEWHSPAPDTVTGNTERGSEFHQQKFLHPQKASLKLDEESTGTSPASESFSNPVDFLDTAEWNEYSVKLSVALCSFLLPPKEIKYCPASSDVSQIHYPSHWHTGSNVSLANTLQHYMLCTFRKVLISAPALLKSFREEGLWDLIFSEKFFYFGSPVDYINPIIHETQNDHFIDASESTGSKSINQADASILQAEAISFLEFAATLNENSNNLVSKLSPSLAMPECSALVGALDHCTYDPGLSGAIIKSFHVILQLATEQTLASFKSIDVLTKVLRVACIQADKLRKLSPPQDDLNGNDSQSKNAQTPDERIKNSLALCGIGFQPFQGICHNI
ncbi:hypothetical protein PR202_ga06543 [Eleusine coracana subsp. coracana]|uniref:Neurobeachin alpha-solenoid region domain-containing protein n=1 Tax=Eleusine coracana subsp. coracana TaxID=191504 RepID=A0AAV5BYQ0_ELECO|nr:hypothetical protein PR202_ga06543 [Eleusine coracana subsp. coracana]